MHLVSEWRPYTAINVLASNHAIEFVNTTVLTPAFYPGDTVKTTLANMMMHKFFCSLDTYYGHLGTYTT